MSKQYRLKLSKNAIRFKKQGSFTLTESSDLSSKIKSNFLINYYADPLFTKVSRLNVEKLNSILKEENLTRKVNGNQNNLKANLKGKLKSTDVNSRDFRKKFQLNNIYDYEKEYFRISYWQKKKNLANNSKDYFKGSSAFGVKKKASRRFLKTTLRRDKQIVDMVKRHLNFYYENNFSVKLNEESNDSIFVSENVSDSVMKSYSQGLKSSEAYLYANFSKKNLFFTLTDMSGNCIRSISSGAEGLKRREKQKPFATRILANKMAKTIISKDINNITIIFNPNNRYQRWRIKPIMRTLETAGISISRVQRKVVQQHGGCRKKKSRRI